MTDRAVSSTVGFVLSLAITAILVSGLLMAGGEFVDTQREVVVESELDVLAEWVAADVSSADRLAISAGTEGAVSYRASLPAWVAGRGYGVAVQNLSDPSDPFNTYAIVLEAHRSTVTTSTRVRTSTPLTETEVSGGTLRIEYVDDDGDGEKDTLEVTRD